MPVPNPRFEGTAGKLRFPVPRGLRPRAAPQAERWPSQTVAQPVPKEELQ